MRPMKVEDLIIMLQQQPMDAEIFVSCQGYNNYDKDKKTFREDDNTYLLKKDGKLFIADSCNIELY